MNRRLRPLVFGSVTVAICTAAFAFACDKNQSTSTSATAAKASGSTKVTAVPAVASDAKGACSYSAKSASASAACATKSTAVAASAKDCCAAKGAKSASANTAAATSTKPAAAPKGEASCHGEDAAAAGYDAVLTGGSQCSGKGVTTMAGRPSHGDCDACSDMALCDGELKEAGSNYQVVKLKNGVMYVYTASNAKSAHAVQTAIARRTERINALVSTSNAKLCPDCKSMRGALASGKLTREVVNVEGGSISLVTSEDPAIVAKLYSIAGLEASKAVKS